MHIFKITYPAFDHAASYLLFWESEEAVLIDCVPKCFDKVQEILDWYDKKLKYILLTHGHIDHIHDLAAFDDYYDFEMDGGFIALSKKDTDKLYTNKHLGDRFNLKFNPISSTPFNIAGYTDYYIDRHHVKILQTPGHTKGSLCYLIEGFLFSGDTLFRGSVGRTDLGDGDSAELQESLKKLMELPENTIVYPGHGLETTIAYEKEYNPYLKNL